MTIRVFLDMDGVIVDYDSYAKAHPGQFVKYVVGAYAEMQPIPGALAAVRSIIGMGFEVWLATKPPTGHAHAYAGKAAWVFEHLPELRRRLILTHDKGLLGGPQDYLVDDRPHKANCEKFAGTLFAFDHKSETFGWPALLQYLSARSPNAVKKSKNIYDELNLPRD